TRECILFGSERRDTFQRGQRCGHHLLKGTVNRQSVSAGLHEVIQVGGGLICISLCHWQGLSDNTTACLKLSETDGQPRPFRRKFRERAANGGGLNDCDLLSPLHDIARMHEYRGDPAFERRRDSHTVPANQAVSTQHESRSATVKV